MAILDERPERSCSYCGNTVRGRSDKKFCSAECRSGFHNYKTSLNDAFMRRVNKMLRKNRKILAALIPEAKAKVHRDRLVDRGFNFRYFTHITTTKEGKEYRFCYEYGYLRLNENWYVLVHRPAHEHPATGPTD